MRGSMNRGHMCSYKFAPYEVDFCNCGQITKFTFLFFTSRMRKIRPSYSNPWYSSSFKRNITVLMKIVDNSEKLVYHSSLKSLLTVQSGISDHQITFAIIPSFMERKLKT